MNDISPTQAHIRAIDDRNAAFDAFLIAKANLDSAQQTEMTLQKQHEEAKAKLNQAQQEYDDAERRRKAAKEYLDLGLFEKN